MDAQITKEEKKYISTLVALTSDLLMAMDRLENLPDCDWYHDYLPQVYEWHDSLGVIYKEANRAIKTCREEVGAQEYIVTVYLDDGSQLQERVIAENPGGATKILLAKYPEAMDIVVE